MSDTVQGPYSPPLGLIEFLDLSPRRPVHDKRRTALAGARYADRLGYRRIWVPEHHGPECPSTNPWLTSAVVANSTTQARVGTAVSLLRVRDPFYTAEEISSVAGLCPGRLDIGFGRGDFGGRGSERVHHLRKTDRQLDEALDTVMALLAPGADGGVEPLAGDWEGWLHGTGTSSARAAGRLGFHYCHALFLNPDLDACLAGFDAYASHLTGRGHTAVALALVANPDPGRAMADAQQQSFPVNCAGTPEECALAIRGALRATGADEVVIAELSTDREDHLRALAALYELVADALTPAAEEASR
ncbi:LLM class flavin-dependent oxidoreductase [Streptomyces fradiae]|uniref:LLM class flavin-dependent oxidoreductase n=1 Tax=Streptomyces fradiae TaxID=1906 RepID=UPI00398731DB